jgi:hypothetical protein
MSALEPSAQGLTLALTDTIATAMMDFIERQRAPVPREVILSVLTHLLATEALLRDVPLSRLETRVREAYYEHAVREDKR